MGLFDAQLSQIGFTPTQGVDTSKADLLTAAGKLGIEAVKGKASADLGKRFEAIKNSRELGEISAERARAEISNAVAASSRSYPGLAADFRKKASEYFGGFGVGAATLDTTDAEALSAAVLKTKAVNMMSKYNLDINNPEDVRRYDSLISDKVSLEFQKQALKGIENDDVLYNRRAKIVAGQEINTQLRGWSTFTSTLINSGELLDEQTRKEYLSKAEFTKNEAILKLDSDYPLMDKKTREEMVGRIERGFKSISDVINNAELLPVLNARREEMAGSAALGILQQDEMLRNIAALSKIATPATIDTYIQAMSSPTFANIYRRATQEGVARIGEAAAMELIDNPQLASADTLRSFMNVSSGKIESALDKVVANTIVHAAGRRVSKDPNAQLNSADRTAANYVISNDVTDIPTSLAPQLQKEMEPIVPSEIGKSIVDLMLEMANDEDLAIIIKDGQLAPNKVQPRQTSSIGRPVGPETELTLKVERLNKLLAQLRALGNTDDAATIMHTVTQLHNRIPREQVEEEPGLLEDAVKSFFRGLKRSGPAFFRGALEFQNVPAQIKRKADEKAMQKEETIINLDADGNVIE